MRHYVHVSAGNAVGIDEYVAYDEIGSDGLWNRCVEIRSDGTALRYSKAHAADGWGVLPEGCWDETEAAKPEHGTLVPIGPELFEAVWRCTKFHNDEDT